MRALLIFFLFCGYALGARWYYVCQIQGKCGDEPDVAPDNRLPTLELRDGDTLVLRGYDQLVFDSAAVAPRLNDNNRVFLDSVAAYLRAHPDKNLTITGYYRPSEEGLRSGFYENLGVARAAEIRRELLERGIAEDRIALDYGRSPTDELPEPVAFDLYTPNEEGPESYDRNAFTFTNMTFSQDNFAFDSDEFRPGDAFILYADSLKTYLDLNTGKKLLIIGHADYIDTKEYNYDLGLRRAKSARQYLKELGINTDIEVQSLGETRPVASNKTDEGRAKNRRVNFVISDKES